MLSMKRNLDCNSTGTLQFGKPQRGIRGKAWEWQGAVQVQAVGMAVLREDEGLCACKETMLKEWDEVLMGIDWWRGIKLTGEKKK